MAIKSIPCGGFFYDDETISFEKDEYGRDVISAAGGGGGSDEIIVEFEAADMTSVTANYTPTQVIDMAATGKLIKGALFMASGNIRNFYYEFSYTPVSFQAIVILSNKLMCFEIVGDDSNDTWSVSDSSYTLTPAT